MSERFTQAIGNTAPPWGRMREISARSALPPTQARFGLFLSHRPCSSRQGKSDAAYQSPTGLVLTYLRLYMVRYSRAMPLGYNSSLSLICPPGCPTSNQPLLIICSVLRTPRGSICKDYRIQEHFPLLLSSIHFKVFFTNDLAYKLYGMFHWSITLFSPIWVKRNLPYCQLMISIRLPSFSLFSCSYFALILCMFLHWHQVCFLQVRVIYSRQFIDQPVKTCIWKWNSVWEERLQSKNRNHICSPHGLFLGSGTPEIM